MHPGAVRLKNNGVVTITIGIFSLYFMNLPNIKIIIEFHVIKINIFLADQYHLFRDIHASRININQINS